MASDQWDGVPLRPERDGWHWLAHSHDHCEPWPFRWVGGEEPGWCAEDGCDPDCADTSPDEMIRYWPFYRGLCLTPADLAARVEAERVAVMAIIAADEKAHEGYVGCNPALIGPRIANAIRALGPTPAYDAAIKAAYKQGWDDREGDFLAGTARIGIDDAAIKAAREDGMEAAVKIAQADERAYQGYVGCNPALIVPRIIAAIRAAKDQPA